MPSLDPLHLPLHKRRTMEDVWKEIGFSSLDHQYTTSASTEGNTNSSDNSRRSIILQEFLAKPFRAQEDSFPTSHYCRENDIGINLNTARSSGDLQFPQALGLSYAPSTDPHVQLSIASDSASNKRIMNKAVDFSGEQRCRQMMKNRESAARSRARKQVFFFNHSMLLSYAPSTDPHVQLSIASDSASNKRIMNKAVDFSGEQRCRQMMKNRESAARSRARKQAYTYELEMEVAQSMEENKRLKRQIQELCMAAASPQVPSKQSLYRTSTSPF